MEKKPFIFNKTVNRETGKAWAEQCSRIQNIVSLYNKLGFAPLINAELHRLFNDTDNFFFEKQTGGELIHVTIGAGADRTHLPVNKAAAKSILKLPKEIEAFLPVLKSTIAELKEGVGGNGVAKMAIVLTSELTRYFQIDEAGMVVYTDRLTDQIFNTGKVFFNSKTGQALANFIDGVEKLYVENGLDKNRFYKRDPIIIIQDLTDKWESETNTFRRKPRFKNEDDRFCRMGDIAEND